MRDGDSVEAAIRQARGDHDGALRLFASAYRTFSAHGYRRRATALALVLARLTGKKRYERYAAEALKGAHASFSMVRELAALRGAGTPSLTHTEQGVLAMVALGRTYGDRYAARCVMEDRRQSRADAVQKTRCAQPG